MNKNLKLILQILVGVAGLILLVVIVGLGLFIRSLPSKSEVASTLKSPESQTAAGKVEAPVTAEKSEASAESEPTASNAEATDSNSEQNKESFEAIVRVLDEDPRVVHVCDQLGQSHFFEDDEAQPRELSFDDLFSPKRDDSVAEALRFPIRAILQDSHVSNLIHELHDVHESNPDAAQLEKEGLLEKMGFYTKIATTVAHLYSNKANFEKMGNRALHLSVIAKVAAMKPEMAQNPIVYDFCRKVEHSMIDNETVDIAKEREDILKMISYAGLTPEEIDFNPEQYIHFSVQSSKDKLSFSLSDEEEKAAHN